MATTVIQRVSSGAIIHGETTAGTWAADAAHVAALTLPLPIAQLVDFDCPLSVEELDATLQSSGGGRAWVAGFIDFPITINVRLDVKQDTAANITHHQIWKDAWAGTKRAYRITFSPGTTGAVRLTCNFLAGPYQRPRPVAQILMASITLQSCSSPARGSGFQLVRDTVP